MDEWWFCQRCGFAFTGDPDDLLCEDCARFLGSAAALYAAWPEDAGWPDELEEVIASDL